MAGSCFLWPWGHSLDSLVLEILAQRRAWRVIDGHPFHDSNDHAWYYFSSVAQFLRHFLAIVIVIVLVPKSKAEGPSVCNMLIISVD